MRLASDEEVTKLVDFCAKIYFDSEDDRHRAISGEIVFAVGKHAIDRFAALAGHILPFVFVAKHDSYARAKELFSDTWNQNVGGSRAVMLYLGEILETASPYLDSPRWSVKHTAAFAVADVIKSLGGGISAHDAGRIWPSMERAMGGKTWDGKETVLEAMVTLAKHSTVLADENVANQMQVCAVILGQRLPAQQLFILYADCSNSLFHRRSSFERVSGTTRNTGPLHLHVSGILSSFARQ